MGLTLTWSPKKMNKNLTPNTVNALSAKTGAVQTAAPHPATPEAPEATPKRGFKPRWLRLQRRERKLKEARALALRPIVG